MSRRFFWSMVAVAIVTLAVGGSAAAILVNRSVTNSARAEFARQAAATARIIELRFFPGGDDSPLPRDLRVTEGLGELLALVKAVGGHDYVEAGLVTGRGGFEPLGEGVHVLIDQVPHPTDLSHSVAFDVEIDGQEVAAIAQPFRIGPRGTLIVVIGTSLQLVPWGEVVVRFGWALALGVLLAALLAGSLARRMAKRVSHLERASAAIAEGDFAARIDVEGSDELARVAAAFNEMGRQLEGARTREREFLVSVSHDLRTPLTTISGYAEAILEGRVPDGDLDRVAGVMNAETGRLQRLVEDLMLLSRIEAREFTLRPEAVQLDAHLEEVMEGFRGRAAAADISLEGNLDDVGSVIVDPDRVAQVVGNLLENALRYTPAGGRVELSLSQAAGPEAVIAVSDTGPGIEAEDLPHIFERLYVTARYRPLRPEGSGLGLSIVAQLVGAMGGTTEVDSSPGTGTTIRVTLPEGTGAQAPLR